MIALEALDSSYTNKANKIIHLQGVNLKIESEDAIAIIGTANSGKTALLRCIACIDVPKAGTVRFNAFSQTVLDSHNVKRATKHLSYIDQTKSLLESKTVYENIAFPLLLANATFSDCAKLTKAALKFLNLEHKANTYPKDLSRLEKVLTCLGRAIITKPKLLVCDEITSGLDHKSSVFIGKKLRQLKMEHKIALVLTTNDLFLIKAVCDKVIVLDKGEIVEKTTANKFLLQPASNIGKEFINLKTRMELPIAIKQRLIKENPNATGIGAGIGTSISTSTGNYADNNNVPTAAAIVRAILPADQNCELILGELIEKFNATISIISAYQEQLKDDTVTVNVMLFELATTMPALNAAIQLLNSNGIYSEVIGYVR